MLLVAIPQGYAALSCFDRIQDFLANESWRETRTLAGEEPSGEHTGDDVQMASLTCSLDNALPGHLGVDVKGPEVECVALENATIGRCDASPVIRNATFRITTHTPLTVILGPIGCGKSTLLKAMLGEALVLGGTIRLATRQVAFCDQTPWVFAGSVRSNILGEAAFEQDWYATVVHACALDTDFNQLSNGDTTAIGSKGSTLSGGQKQRIVSYARPWAETSDRFAHMHTDHGSGAVCAEATCSLRRCAQRSRRGDAGAHRGARVWTSRFAEEDWDDGGAGGPHG